MKDGILLLLVRFFESESCEIRRLRSDNMKFICNHPDCGDDEALEWAEGEIELEKLRSSLPWIVSDVAEGVDNDLDEVDRLIEVFDDVLSELPF